MAKSIRVASLTALAAVDGNDIEAGYYADVITSTVIYTYYCDSSGDAESSPLIIAPDTNPGSLRWKLVGLNAKTLTLSSGATVDEIVTSISAGGADDQLVTSEGIAEEIAAQASLSAVHPGFMIVPEFAYNGGSTAYTATMGASRGYCKDKRYYHTSALTTPAISGATADTRYYLYFDYSAMTDGVALTNSELIWSTTAPTHNGTYDQQMNGDDRWTGLMVVSNSTPDNIVEFVGTPGMIVIVSAFTDRASSNITTSFVETSLTGPEIEGIEMSIGIGVVADANVGIGYYRPYGTAGDGIPCFDGNSQTYNTDHTMNTLRVATGLYGSSPAIDIKASQNNANVVVYSSGYYFPRGMGR